MKEIIIAVAGSGAENNYHDVKILPETRAKDVLEKLELKGFQIQKPDGGFFALADNIYDAVESGQKLFATKSGVEAGVQAA